MVDERQVVCSFEEDSQSCQGSSGLHYLYVEASNGSVNYGDRVIDYATRKMIRQSLPEPAGMFDPWTGAYPKGEYDLMIIPGVTMLTEGHRLRPGLASLASLPFPVFCLSGNVWRPLPRNGVLLRSRVLFRGKTQNEGLGVVRSLASPVGVRDPETRDLLTRSSVQCLYTGCPTMQLAGDGVGDDGFLLFSLGRSCVRWQTRLARRLSRDIPVVGLCHEVGDWSRYRAAGWDLPLVDWGGDVELYLSYFRRAHVVVTGRLHGALPSLAFGKRVFYFGTRDTRTSILDDLGIRIHDTNDCDDVLNRATNAHNRALVAYWRENWDRLLSCIWRYVKEARRKPLG